MPTGKERPAHAIDVALGRVHGSFMWAIRRPSDRHTFFFNGPQLGYQAPNTFVELDLKAPGVRLHTGTAPGVPVNSNGYNAHMAWGVTSGLSDDDDLFAVRLAGPERYRFRGRIRRMSCRTERFRYTEGGTMKSTKRRLCRTVQGPVQARAGGWAFARRYAIWGRELGTFEGLAGLGAARDLRGGRPGSAEDHLDGEHPRRRRPGSHRLLASGAVPAARSALGRAASAPGRRPRGVARAAAPEARPRM